VPPELERNCTKKIEPEKKGTTLPRGDDEG
jgi:hypothetical protein